MVPFLFVALRHDFIYFVRVVSSGAHLDPVVVVVVRKDTVYATHTGDMRVCADFNSACEWCDAKTRGALLWWWCWVITRADKKKITANKVKHAISFFCFFYIGISLFTFFFLGESQQKNRRQSGVGKIFFLRIFLCIWRVSGKVTTTQSYRQCLVFFFWVSVRHFSIYSQSI